MYIEERWHNEVKSIDNNLYIVFNENIERFEIRHRLPFHDIDRRILIVEDGGDFRRIDYDILRQLKYNYPWEAIYKYKDQESLADWYLEQKKIQKEYNEKMRYNYRQDFISDNMKSFEKVADEMGRNASKRAIKKLKLNDEYQEFVDSKKPKNY